MSQGVELVPAPSAPVGSTSGVDFYAVVHITSAVPMEAAAVALGVESLVNADANFTAEVFDCGLRIP